ncbi:claudin-6-like isoform X2 [Lampris incognitus]|uniref:claudin-6-like isoform X2 n=1 Tax=Lampris incognitus TaxID=2546036 RepID=UPI0024B57784|nr:claudin-6-like isoform X2 [Lampris incognitus]
MASTGLQLLGLLLAVLGWVGGALVCAAPLWRVSAFVGGELVIAQVLWEGLWMNCLSQTTGHIQCKTYDSTLALPTSDQVARSLTVLSLLLCLLALMLGVAGVKCTRCMGDRNHVSKARLARIAGILFLVAGLVYLIPICVTTYATEEERRLCLGEQGETTHKQWQQERWNNRRRLLYEMLESWYEM